MTDLQQMCLAAILYICFYRHMASLPELVKEIT